MGIAAGSGCGVHAKPNGASDSSTASHSAESSDSAKRSDWLLAAKPMHTSMLESCRASRHRDAPCASGRGQGLEDLFGAKKVHTGMWKGFASSRQRRRSTHPCQ
uniref:Uncharacterized protein n=1 Tax=Chrysotila carterae TaxID=13221 RepID=A0A7S4BHQ8_CHRCT